MATWYVNGLSWGHLDQQYKASTAQVGRLTYKKKSVKSNVIVAVKKVQVLTELMMDNTKHEFITLFKVLQLAYRGLRLLTNYLSVSAIFHTSDLMLAATFQFIVNWNEIF